jgi:tRNA(Ile)-lysidine synthase
MDLSKQVLQTIIQQKLTKRGDAILVGVSGGVDSVVLLHILYQLRHQLAIKLHVVHFNHRLRLSANRDERFVKGLAQRLNLPITIQRRKGTQKIKLVSEDQARQWRFAFFAKVASQTRSQAIALAHHQNDLAETVLMRLLRGTGLSGLRGILGETHIAKVKFIRPLLSIQRVSIEKYAKDNGLKYCHDETNDQTHYLRNKIRLKLMPDLVKNYNSNFSHTLVDLAYTSQADYEYLFLQAQKLFKKNATITKSVVTMKFKFLIKQHVSIQRMLLRLAFESLVSNYKQLSLKHIQEVEDMLMNRPAGTILHWPQSIKVKRTKDRVMLQL